MATSKKIFTRDISWLKFNGRVLQEAQDPHNPLYDRLKFLGIFSNNQDEFFRVRVAALNRMTSWGKNVKMHLEQNPKKILKEINEIVQQQSQVFDKTYQKIIKELKSEKILIKNEKELSQEQEIFVRQYFKDEIRSIIVPLMIESIPKLPLLKDNTIYLASILGSSTQSLMHRYALIEVPAKRLNRFIQLPTRRGEYHFILLEDIIRFNLPYIFSPLGFDRFSGYIVKVTRDAEFELDHEEINVTDALEKAIRNRKKGKATRLVYDREIPPAFLEYLVKRLHMSSDDSIIAGGRIHNFKDFMKFPKHVFKKSQIFKMKDGIVPKELEPPVKLMDVIRDKDVLVHYPYQSFEPLIDLLREAAIDPYVDAIKLTIYRLAQDSKILNALVNAVRNGKTVTVILELRARFDEENNIYWKEKLEEEGVQVFTGTRDYKVHAKLCLITRKEFDRTESFAIVSTGNFNEDTSKVYSDLSILTANKNVTRDIENVFDYLCNENKGVQQLKKNKTLITSPLQTRSFFLDLIQKETDYARKGIKAEITLKLNSLIDEILIMKLYEAAENGVQVNVIVRGICGIIPEGKWGRNMKVISIVDHYLEHARVMAFRNNGNPEVFISSADWMIRNMDHRVETTLPVMDEDVKNEIMELLEMQLKDNVKARVINKTQSNTYVKPVAGQEQVRSQQAILAALTHKNKK